MLEKLNNLNLSGECLGVNDSVEKCEYTISTEKTSEGVQITIDCQSWLGVNCIFNEIYKNFTLEQFLSDLHDQNLEDIENKIADYLGIY